MSKRKQKGRPVNGVLLLDKPLHLSSNQALQKVKRLYDARKAGHTGSLDPLATGMLPVCLGEATKMSAYLLDADKTYRFRCRLGTATSTADAEGEVIESLPWGYIQAADIERVLAQFLGDIEQVPPMHSALKKDGQRLYELARKGEQVERKPRPVHIYALQMLGFEQGEIHLEVVCSKGTYVRTLAEDIGRALGSCAYVTELQRLRVGPYQPPMVTLAEVEAAARQGQPALDALLLPVDSGIQDWPAVVVDDDSAYYLKLGQPVQVARAPTEGLVRLYQGEQFLGVGIIDDRGRVAPKRMLVG